MALIFLFTARSRKAGEMTVRLDTDAPALMLRLMEYNARKKRRERLEQLAQENEEEENEVRYCQEQIAFLLQKEEETRTRSASILLSEIADGGEGATPNNFLGGPYDLEIVGEPDQPELNRDEYEALIPGKDDDSIFGFESYPSDGLEENVKPAPPEQEALPGNLTTSPNTPDKQIGNNPTGNGLFQPEPEDEVLGNLKALLEE